MHIIKKQWKCKKKHSQLRFLLNTPEYQCQHWKLSKSLPLLRYHWKLSKSLPLLHYQTHQSLSCDQTCYYFFAWQTRWLPSGPTSVPLPQKEYYQSQRSCCLIYVTTFNSFATIIKKQNSTTLLIFIHSISVHQNQKKKQKKISTTVQIRVFTLYPLNDHKKSILRFKIRQTWYLSHWIQASYSGFSLVVISMQEERGCEMWGWWL